MSVPVMVAMRAVATLMVVSYNCCDANSVPELASNNSNEKLVYLDDILLLAKGFAWIGVPRAEYTWGPSQCPLLATVSDNSLDACKISCESMTDKGCHAINYFYDVKKCELKACALPVTTPNDRNRVYPGPRAAFFINAFQGNPCYPGEKPQTSKDGGVLCETGKPVVWTTNDLSLGACWDTYLPPIPDCSHVTIKDFAFNVKLEPGWVKHYEEHKSDFARFGYKTLESSCRILFDRASYVFERQFSVRLAVGTVEANGKIIGGDYPAGPFAGQVRLDVTGRGGAALAGLCQKGAGMLGSDHAPFNAAGQFVCASPWTLVHEMGHFLGSPHTPINKPDFMTVNGMPSFRRCAGQPCTYRSFLPWKDTTSYGKSICPKLDNQYMTCQVNLKLESFGKLAWVSAFLGQDCSTACAQRSMSCDEAELKKVVGVPAVRDVARAAGQTCEREIGWAYDFSPSICKLGSYTGWCTFGNTGKRSCAAQSYPDHSRLCPCVPNQKPPEQKPGWMLAARGQDCSSACAQRSMPCDEAELLKVVGVASVMDVARAAGQPCKKEVGWGYDFSPSICTSATGAGCASGSFTGWCTYGNNGRRSCAAKSYSDHSRLCPCGNFGGPRDAKLALAGEIRDVPWSKAVAPGVAVGIIALGLLVAITLTLRRRNAPSGSSLAEKLCEDLTV